MYVDLSMQVISEVLFMPHRIFLLAGCKRFRHFALFLHWQKKFEFWWKLLFGVKAIREVNSIIIINC